MGKIKIYIYHHIGRKIRTSEDEKQLINFTCPCVKKNQKKKHKKLKAQDQLFTFSSIEPLEAKAH